MSFIRTNLTLALAIAGLSLVSPARAAIIGGVDFPQGAISFAEAVVTYGVGGGGVGAAYQDPANALGIPNYIGANTCASTATCTFVSLGDGGSVVLRFVNNVLTGSGDNGLDLWVFEVGPDVEDTFVDISVDGSTWFSVGKVFGSTAGIDIDAYGFGTSSAFSYVRLTDDTNEGGQSGATAGADIDAVGAISTRAVSSVPEPGAGGLLGLGLLGLAWLKRARS